MIRSHAQNAKLWVDHDTTDNELMELVNNISTNYTYFNWEKIHFVFFHKEARMKSQNRRKTRVWSEGCSTGEEPSTLTMLICEYFRT